MSSTILLSDNGATSGISGYQLTGGDDGTLTIQTTTSGGTPTTALTIGTDQVVTFAQPPAGIDAFASGTAMMFVQTAAPTGWTKSTSHDNKALRVVSGTAGTGGSVAFTTAFTTQSAGGTVGSTTLATSQVPNASGTFYAANRPGVAPTGVFTFTGATSNSSLSGGGLTGDIRQYNMNLGFGGGSHNHSFTGSSINLAVQYVDVIIATKD